jgi:hypothetical protein
MSHNEQGLWCLHVLGPDDVFPAPDRATAQLWAAQWTLWNLRHDPNPDGLDPVVNWAVAPWPHSSETHADGLASSIAANTFASDPLAGTLADSNLIAAENAGLDLAAEIVAGIEHWGLSPTKLEPVKSFQKFAAETILKQKEGTAIRLAARQ